MKQAEQIHDKVPPQNIEAEQSVLGSILLDSNALTSALEILSPDDFYKESHRKIFLAITELFDKSEPADIITTADQLLKNNSLEQIGGSHYLASLVSIMPTSANVRHHARIVKENSILRSLLRAVTDIASNVYKNELDSEDLIDYAEKTIFEISDKRIKVSFVPLKSLIRDSFHMIEQLYDRKEAITGVPTGFKELDELTTGLQQSDLIIIGGRPGMGKTAFSLNIAQYVGLHLKEPVAIFSLEMAKEQLALRMLCSEAMVDSHKIRKGFIKKEDWHKMTSAAGLLAESPIFIDDSAAMSVLEMRAKARRLKAEHGLSLIIVDYLQLMRGKSSYERREQEISDISRSLKALAKELRVPVIALSQLNRAVETRGGNKKPTLADLRESGAIEQDADVIIFIYKEESSDGDAAEVRGRAIIDVAKQRNGPTESIKLTFLANYTRFVERSDREVVEVDDVF